MDTTKPAVPCAQCGEPVWPDQTLHMRYAVDEEGAATSPVVLVHEGCAEAFDAQHPSAD